MFALSLVNRYKSPVRQLSMPKIGMKSITPSLQSVTQYAIVKARVDKHSRELTLFAAS